MLIMEIKTVKTRKQIEDILKDFILNHKTVEFKHKYCKPKRFGTK